jgi:hypothetical protein
MKRALIWILSLSVSAAALAFAQETKTQDGKAAESKTAQRNRRARPSTSTAAKPSPEMIRLADNLAGRWAVSGKQEPSPDAPEGDTGSGKEYIHRGPGAQSLISDLRMTFAKAGSFTGHGVLYWDADAKAYKGFWCESVSPVCEQAGLGRWNGNNLVFEGEINMDGQRVQTRQTYSAITHDSFTWTAEMKTPEGMKPLLSFEYKRIARGAADSAHSAQEEQLMPNQQQPIMRKDERSAKSKD